jgi:hypothetical protein
MIEAFHSYGLKTVFSALELAKSHTGLTPIFVVVTPSCVVELAYIRVTSWRSNS